MVPLPSSSGSADTGVPILKRRPDVIPFVTQGRHGKCPNLPVGKHMSRSREGCPTHDSPVMTVCLASPRSSPESGAYPWSTRHSHDLGSPIGLKHVLQEDGAAPVRRRTGRIDHMAVFDPKAIASGVGQANAHRPRSSWRWRYRTSQRSAHMSFTAMRVSLEGRLIGKLTIGQASPGRSHCDNDSHRCRCPPRPQAGP